MIVRQIFLHRHPPRFSTLRTECNWILGFTTRLWFDFHNSHCIFVVASSSFERKVSFHSSTVGSKHLSPTLQHVSFPRKLTLRRMTIFTRRFRASTIKQHLHSYQQTTHGDFWIDYFPFSTHFALVIRLAEKAWGSVFCFFVHDLGLRDGNCIGLLSNIVTNTRLTRSTPITLFRLLITTPSSILPCLMSQFYNRSFWSVLYFFSIVFNFTKLWINIFWWLFMSQDPIRVWVDWTCVSSIWTDFPRFHRMESLTSIIELRPISNRIPERSYYVE